MATRIESFAINSGLCPETLLKRVRPSLYPNPHSELYQEERLWHGLKLLITRSIFPVRLSATEKERIKDLAVEPGITASEYKYMRRCPLDKRLHTKVNLKAMVELSRLSGQQKLSNYARAGALIVGVQITTELHGWQHVSELRSERNYEHIKQRLANVLNRWVGTGRISEEAYRQALRRPPGDLGRMAQKSPGRHERFDATRSQGLVICSDRSGW